ncbi:hypothetical protein L198_07970 [Cryptococcus wingfieldii CBS 7118]|uniref:Uncharacterized protein n=1 Tax=Cryptococcus wingfieldii CBS 7118 TaxID=1295528 RepID=A0A1E3HRW1_9TREE|nr:hypothetical protein L198_07970 [Cryptococcus wingfieldii CBS 7118]ODN78181.1 hypothetical protein L198_07970 [Cryptococcus wingfieldii CBS 7118]
MDLPSLTATCSWTGCETTLDPLSCHYACPDHVDNARLRNERISCKKDFEKKHERWCRPREVATMMKDVEKVRLPGFTVFPNEAYLRESFQSSLTSHRIMKRPFDFRGQFTVRPKIRPRNEEGEALAWIRGIARFFIADDDLVFGKNIPYRFGEWTVEFSSASVGISLRCSQSVEALPAERKPCRPSPIPIQSERSASPYDASPSQRERSASPSPPTTLKRKRSASNFPTTDANDPPDARDHFECDGRLDILYSADTSILTLTSSHSIPHVPYNGEKAYTEEDAERTRAEMQEQADMLEELGESLRERLKKDQVDFGDSAYFSAMLDRVRELSEKMTLLEEKQEQERQLEQRGKKEATGRWRRKLSAESMLP